MAKKSTKKKYKDLRHPITYRRENGEFDVDWYVKEDRSKWVLPYILKKQAKKLGKNNPNLSNDNALDNLKLLLLLLNCGHPILKSEKRNELELTNIFFILVSSLL